VERETDHCYKTSTLQTEVAHSPKIWVPQSIDMLCYQNPKSHTQNNSDFFSNKVVQIKVSMVALNQQYQHKKNFRTKADEEYTRSQFFVTLCNNTREVLVIMLHCL